MSDPVDTLVRAVLYEGYALYPYRPSALKNQRRFAFGVVYPRAWAERTLDAATLRVEVVVAGDGASIAATVRFLRLTRGGGAREVAIELGACTRTSGATIEHFDRDGLALEIETRATLDAASLWRFAVEIRNVTALDADADHEAVMDVVPASTHVVIRVAGGELVSAIDPPGERDRSGRRVSVQRPLPGARDGRRHARVADHPAGPSGDRAAEPW